MTFSPKAYLDLVVLEVVKKMIEDRIVADNKVKEVKQKKMSRKALLWEKVRTLSHQGSIV